MNSKDLMNREKMEPWLIWGAAALFAFFALYLQASVSVMIDPLKDTFKISNIGIGFLASSFFYTYAIMQIPIGAMIDKFGVRRVLAVSVVGTFYSCVLFAYAESYTTLIIARVAMGFFAASAFPCAFCLAAVWFPRNLFPTVAGYTEMLGMFGGAFAADFLSRFILGYGWRTTSLLSGCIAATLAFLAIYSVKDRKTAGMITNKGIIENGNTDAEILRKDNTSIGQKLKTVFTDGQIWNLSLYAAMMFIPLSTFAALWGIPFIMSKYNVDLRFAANCMMIVFVGGAIGNPVVSWLSHRFDKKKGFMFVGSVISLIFMCLVLYFKLPHPLLYLLLFLAGFSCTVYIIPYSIVKDKVSDDIRGTAMSFTNAICGCVGTLLLEPVVGWFVHYLQSDKGTKITGYLPFEPFTIALSIVPICLILSFFFLLRIKDKGMEEAVIEVESETRD